jgi:hypothetical protein
MWFHLDNSDYSYRRAALATADKPQGPFTFLYGFQPDNIPSLDMNLFLDPIDGEVRQGSFNSVPGRGPRGSASTKWMTFSAPSYPRRTLFGHAITNTPAFPGRSQTRVSISHRKGPVFLAGSSILSPTNSPLLQSYGRLPEHNGSHFQPLSVCAVVCLAPTATMWPAPGNHTTLVPAKTTVLKAWPFFGCLPTARTTSFPHT